MSILLGCAILLVSGTCLVSGQGGEDGDTVYIDNEYMVLVDDTKTNATDAEFTDKLQNDFQLTVYEVDHFTTVRVFGVRGEAADADRAALLPEVSKVEQNAVVSVSARVPKFPCSVCHKVSAARAWGLDRVDQRDKLISGDPFNFDADYMVGPHRGAGVVAYVVDTGLDVSHPEFGGRAFCLHAAPGTGTCSDDGYKHGTHVAGTIGSSRYGVAKEVTLIGAKIFDNSGFGTASSVCNGLSWVLNHHNSRWNFPLIAKSVVNMSFGGPSSTIIVTVVNMLLAAGITAVAAAGNSNGNACSQSPANVAGAITVGATTVDNESAWFTNWGPCVDVFAPGLDVMSTLPGNGAGPNSGTSMAAPHVTGAVAIEMSRRILPSLPGDMHDFIVDGASEGKITFVTANHNTSPNLLLHIPCCDISKRDAKTIGRH